MGRAQATGKEEGEVAASHDENRDLLTTHRDRDRQAGRETHKEIERQRD